MSTDNEPSGFPDSVDVNDVIVHHDDELSQQPLEGSLEVDPNWPFDKLPSMSNLLGSGSGNTPFFYQESRPASEGKVLPVAPTKKLELDKEAVSLAASEAFEELCDAFMNYVKALSSEVAFQVKEQLSYNGSQTEE